MDTYYTTDEKYLKAVDAYSYGRSRKSLRILNEIIAAEPTYARAYFQLGLIYYYELKDYQQAGYCFKTCNQLEPTFPDVYEHYLELLAFLDMGKLLNTIQAKALQTPGVEHSEVWTIMGRFAEKNKQLAQAKTCYDHAFILSTDTEDMEEIGASIKRIETKQERSAMYRYILS